MRPRIPSPTERQMRADRFASELLPDDLEPTESAPHPVAPPHAQRAAEEVIGEARWRSVAIALAAILAAFIAFSTLKGRRDPHQSIDPASPGVKRNG